jgi:hypothetical protein
MTLDHDVWKMSYQSFNLHQFTNSQHSTIEDSAVYKRDVPTFTVHYTVDAAMTKTTPLSGDYNELSVVSEEFLDSIFRSVFEDMPVRHDATRVFGMLNGQGPFTVDFEVSLDFIVPSEVPTVGFLIDRIREAFEREASSESYLFDLHAMSETNPFSGTISFSLVDRAEPPAAEVNNEPGTPPEDTTTETTEKDIAMVIFLAGIGFFVLAAVAFLWVRSCRVKQLCVDDQIDAGSESLRRSTGEENDVDDETLRYLNTIRNRYRDEEDHHNVVRSAFDDVTLAPEKNESIGTFVEKDSTSQRREGTKNYDDDHDALLCVHENFVDTQEISDTRLFDTDLALRQNTENVCENRSRDFNYLGLEINNASFEEEDLRSIN